MLLTVSLTSLAGCTGLPSKIETPRVTLAALEPLRMTILEQHYALTFLVENPNDVPLEVRGLSYVIAFNDREFARGENEGDIAVPARGESLMRVQVKSNLAQLVEQLRAFAQEESSTLRYSINGHVRLAGPFGRIPFEYEGELGQSRGSSGSSEPKGIAI